eukprot:3904403-Rhodomonas_salina.3
MRYWTVIDNTQITALRAARLTPPSSASARSRHSEASSSSPQLPSARQVLFPFKVRARKAERAAMRCVRCAMCDVRCAMCGPA